MLTEPVGCHIGVFLHPVIKFGHPVLFVIHMSKFLKAVDTISNYSKKLSA